MADDEAIAAHPANARVLRHFRWARGDSPVVPLSRAPTDSDLYGLGTHPDLVEHLWKGLTRKLPTDCAWVVCARPTLVHPESGIIFGFAGGTHDYALRLPEVVRQRAAIVSPKRIRSYPASRVVLDLDEAGPEWIFGGWFDGEADWCVAAWEFARERGVQ
jgi:hypothetical protein